MSDRPTGIHFGTAELEAASRLITLALQEDLGHAGDITSSACIRPEEQGAVQIVARETGVLAGVPVVAMVFSVLDPAIEIQEELHDGQRVERGSVVATVTGSVRSLLSGERTVLNFLTYLSGIATATERYARAIQGSRARIYDTRKTLPGWRMLAKYAVRAGGGANHRIGLFDAVLLKDNHLAAWAASGAGHTIAAVVQAARQTVAPGTIVEVEVDTLAQLEDALAGSPDIVLLDNMSCELLRQAVALRDLKAPLVQLEASGGITLSSVADVAATGVERISSGALTHSVTTLDLAFDWKLSGDHDG